MQFISNELYYGLRYVCAIHWVELLLGKLFGVVVYPLEICSTKKIVHKYYKQTGHRYSAR
jgi:hypothetical protein